LLTDLVLPALPFGTDQSSTHRGRKKAFGFGVEVQKAFRKFRQALGRLVRREGLVDRHIWLLDGRLVHPGATTYTADMRLWISRYTHVQRIDEGPRA
jgi:Rad3-related DNA helicase